MKTSFFKYYKGTAGVAICLYPPLNWKGEWFPELAPTKEIFHAIKYGNINEAQYEERFKKEVLSKLNPTEVYEKLKDKVLLCYEESDKFCHRHIVASWLKESLGIEVTEWNVSDEYKKINTNPLF